MSTNQTPIAIPARVIEYWLRCHTPLASAPILRGDPRIEARR